MFKEIEEIIKSWKMKKIMTKFVTTLANYINLDMIELARGKKSSSFIKTKCFKENIQNKIEQLLPEFTYKEWIMILSASNEYEKLSNNKEEDIKVNLTKFLTAHYKELYQLFNMEHYDTYQIKEKENISKLIVAQDVYLDDKSIIVVLLYYKDGSRMCYDPETGKRMIIENIEVRPESMIITFVESTPSTLEKWKKILLDLFTEEE